DYYCNSYASTYTYIF
nr:immunoglobulin light chain junction region [Macaca mulatta]MOX44565.1 immunoglobulin light chain junction region [Macaca mulatta]